MNVSRRGPRGVWRGLGIRPFFQQPCCDASGCSLAVMGASEQIQTLLQPIAASCVLLPVCLVSDKPGGSTPDRPIGLFGTRPPACCLKCY